jgi:hypothetical protein
MYFGRKYHAAMRFYFLQTLFKQALKHVLYMAVYLISKGESSKMKKKDSEITLSEKLGFDCRIWSRTN